MAKMVVEFEWSDELGEKWMNMDNLELLLYGQMYTKRELLSIKELEQVRLVYQESDGVRIEGIN